MSKAMHRDSTLHARREELLDALKDTRVPIVVLIDELDRVEDAEIRAVAQLVRAVADFSSISYVIAYDHDRVVQALGAGGDVPTRTERGRAYLEKIVQFQISLPVTFGEELSDLLLAELDKLTIDVALPREWQTNERFIALLGTMIPRPVETPRDVKRLVGTYHVIGSMLRGEVDWVDLLAFSALLIKAPATVAKLRQDPDRDVENPISPRSLYERMSDPENDGESELNRFIPEEEATADVKGLLGFLFSRFSPHSLRSDRHSDSLCFRRPLVTVLRLGLPDGALSSSLLKKTLFRCRIDRHRDAVWDFIVWGNRRAVGFHLKQDHQEAAVDMSEGLFFGFAAGDGSVAFECRASCMPGFRLRRDLDVKCVRHAEASLARSLGMRVRL